MAVVPIPHREKGPRLPMWQQLRIASEPEIDEYFPVGRGNVGVVLGSASGNLCDVDLDCDAAVGIADLMLPVTGSIFGRASRERTHRLYRTDVEAGYLEFRAPDKQMMLELRGNDKHQTVFPGSVHPSGEPVEWHADGEPADISAAELIAACRMVAAAALLAMEYPALGARHDCALAIAGGMLRLGIDQVDVEEFVEAVCTVGGCDDVMTKVRGVATTAAKIQANEPVTGWPSVGKIVGEATVERVLKFLRPLEAAGAIRRDAAGKDDCTPDRVLDPDDPLTTAKLFVEERCMFGEAQTLVSHGRVFNRWNKKCYRETEADELRNDIYEYTAKAVVRKKSRRGETYYVPFKPTKQKIDKIIDALHASLHLSQSTSVPCWRDPATIPRPSELLPCENGLLHVPTRTLLPATPDLFIQYSIPLVYSDCAPTPTRWLSFLDQLWENDLESITLLQEWFGYLLTVDTSLHKMLLLIGPRRSGKGTIGRVLAALLGAMNVAGPTLASLATNFGLQPLIGKPLAIISDARLGNRTDQSVITERLLTISGEDWLTIDRKYLTAWSGRLPTRIMIMTNEIPRLLDVSGALAGRFLVLRMTQSFFDREDPGLFQSLLRELDGILAWALEGYDSLTERGYFVQPASSKAVVEELADLASPIASFVRSCCELGEGHEVTKDALYGAWRRWCRDEGREYPGTKSTFGRDVLATMPQVVSARPRAGGNRVHVYRGIRLVGGWSGQVRGLIQ